MQTPDPTSRACRSRAAQTGIILSTLLAAPMALAAPAALEPGARLCLHPVDLPIEVAEDDPRPRTLEQKLRAVLEAGGLEVVDSAEVDAVVERLKDESEGAIDPYTGRLDPQRWQAQKAALAHALRSELGCDARVRAAVVPVKALFSQAWASWDGQRQTISSEGRILLNALGGVIESGWVQALSLWVRVVDLEGRSIAFRSAGIETLVSLAVLKDRDLLPEDQWLRDESRLDEAISLALGAGASALQRRGHPRPKVIR